MMDYYSFIAAICILLPLAFAIAGGVKNKRRVGRGQEPESLMPLYFLAAMVEPGAFVGLGSAMHDTRQYHETGDLVFLAGFVFASLLVLDSISLLIKSIKAKRARDAAYSTASCLAWGFGALLLLLNMSSMGS